MVVELEQEFLQGALSGINEVPMVVTSSLNSGTEDAELLAGIMGFQLIDGKNEATIKKASVNCEPLLVHVL